MKQKLFAVGHGALAKPSGTCEVEHWHRQWHTGTREVEQWAKPVARES
jgi:hypothetical protein